MAKARMLHNSISKSLQVSNLPIPAILLFTWIIAHADDEGRLKGDPRFIKMAVVPGIKWSYQIIAKYLNLIKDAGLIYYWQQNNEWFIEFVKWDKYQTIREDRRKPSYLPSYSHTNDSQLVTISQPNDNQQSTQDNINEIKLIEVKTSEVKPNEPIADKNSPEEVGRLYNPKTFVPSNEVETAAFEAWKSLEYNNPLAFHTTYMHWCRKGLPTQLFYQFVSEIKQDKSITKPGAIFNKKAKIYLDGIK